MSWEATAYVKSLSICPDGAPMNRGQKLLALILADYHNTHRRAAWPSIPTLAGEALTSHAQAKRDLAYLEAHSLIRKVRPEKMGRGWVCAYEFVALDGSEDLQRSKSEPKKGAHHEPLFSAPERGSEVAHQKEESGSEVAQKGLTESSAIRKNKEQELERTRTNPQKSPSVEIVRHQSVPCSDDAGAFRDVIKRELERAGYETRGEVFCSDRGDGYAGRIDLVAKRGADLLAIECDREQPREKSQIKLMGYPATRRLIILRDPAGGFMDAPCFEDLIMDCERAD